MGAKRTKLLTPSPEFWRWVAEYAFGEYLNRGRGFFLMREPVVRDEKTGLCRYSKTAFVPADIDRPDALQVATEALRRHDPRETVVVVVQGEDGRLVVKEMGKKDLGARPIDAYREWGARNGEGHLFPGEVVRLKQDIPDAATQGYYVFLERKGCLMRLCKAEGDADKGFRSTQEGIELHCDFEEYFSASDGLIVPMPAKIVIEKAWGSEGT